MSAEITRAAEPCANCVLRYTEPPEIYREVYPLLRQTGAHLG